MTADEQAQHKGNAAALCNDAANINQARVEAIARQLTGDPESSGWQYYCDIAQRIIAADPATGWLDEYGKEVDRLLGLFTLQTDMDAGMRKADAESTKVRREAYDNAFDQLKQQLAAANAELEAERDAKLRLMGQIADMMQEKDAAQAEIERLRQKNIRLDNVAVAQIERQSAQLAEAKKALRSSRGWLITCSESAQARKDLAKLDDTLKRLEQSNE